MINKLIDKTLNLSLMENKIVFQSVLHNDKAEIEYVKKDYGATPSKGLIHGLQKDAIQNAVGATATRKFRDWKITFELKEINGSDALIFTDEGTVGLIGEIIPDQQEIMRRVGENSLSGDEHLSRFRTVFVSGDNTGPGSYGRGKLVFQACSSTNTILIESHRSSDNKYIAFKRCLDGVRLVESQIFEDASAREFINSETDSSIELLKNFGTRIIILDLDPSKQVNGLSIKESFLRSFSDEKDDECDTSFDQMIMETWWELLEKYKDFGVEIFLKHKSKVKKVELSELKRKILYNADFKDGWRIYEKKDIPVTIDSNTYKIKQLRFFVSPKGESLPENFRIIFSQRKKMKIGEIGRNIYPHQQIIKNFGGFVVFDENLDEEILCPENLTHYGYDDMKRYPLKNIRDQIRTHLEKFHEIQGLGKTESEGILSKTLNDVLKDINEHANELGLITAFGSGKRKKNFEIKISDFFLPHDDSLKVEYSDSVGPVYFSIINNSNIDTNIKINAYLEQYKSTHMQRLYNDELDIAAKEEIELEIDEFSIDSDFTYSIPVKFCIELPDHSVINSRFIWLGLEPERKKQDFPLKLTEFTINYSKEDTRRMEIGESFSDISFTIVNEFPSTFNCSLNLKVVWKSPDGPVDISNLIEDEFTLNKLTDISFEKDELVLSIEEFDFIEKEPINHKSRTFELQLQVLASSDSTDNNYVEGQKLMQTKTVKFYIGIDDPGMSIFSDARDVKAPDDPRRSWWKKDAGSYVFYINVAHPYFSRLNIYNDLRYDYIKEEMLKSAYEVCLKEELYGGIFEDYNMLTSESNTYEETFRQKLSKEDTVILFDELVGNALHKLYSE